MAPKKGRKADAKESKGNRDPISSDDAVTFMLEEQEKKEAKRLKRGASTSTSASRKSRKSDEVASSLSIASKPSFIQEYSAEDSEEESSDDENKNTCYKQKGRSKKDDSDEDDDVIAAMKGDLCDNTKTALSIMASNPVLASMFRVDPGKIARALKKHKSSRAIADAFEPIPACPGDGQMVPYVAPPHPEPKVWFENLNKNYEAFFAAMRSYRKLILDETYAYLSSYNKEKTESTLQSAIFEKLPKGQHEFPASSKPKWMIWSLSGVKRRISIQKCEVREIARKQMCVVNEVPHEHSAVVAKFGISCTPPRSKPQTRASPGGSDDFGSENFPAWMRGVAGAIKVPVEKFSLYFIADLLFATDIWIKTGLKLQPYKDHSDKVDVYMQMILTCTEGKSQFLVEKVVKAHKRGRGN